MSMGKQLVTRRIINFFLPDRVRSFASSVVLNPTIDYEEFEKYRKEHSKSVVIVDVRDPDELISPGAISGTVNVPLGEIANAFGELNVNEFSAKYGVEKPNATDPLVFFCLKGIRSQSAMDTVKALGFSNTANYVGSYLDWAEKNKS
ncbi:uncharacterized protein [Lepeophtheirus salmonis]|uniref:Heat shock protein 67B2 [Salmo salar] n=1 Tax=Lepeophtheirus salmonis TaxID=72036 RepID=A0A0K2VD74_LEPSM|nr:putative thiosulfate sulfurtransferase, mitochondrial isoform X1 [Lepeophtheirus salmonis]